MTENFYQTRIFDMIRDKALNTDEIQAALLDYSYNHGDDGGFVMKAQCKEGFLPYTKSNSVDGSGKKRSFELPSTSASSPESSNTSAVAPSLATCPRKS